jgi:prefoldin subunit 5
MSDSSDDLIAQLQLIQKRLDGLTTQNEELIEAFATAIRTMTQWLQRLSKRPVMQ